MTAIRALPGDILQVACKARDYHFQLSSREDTVRWATNLVTLALEAGYDVPGTMILPPEDAEDEAVAAESASADAAEDYAVASAS